MFNIGGNLCLRPFGPKCKAFQAHCEITDFGEYNDGVLRQGLSIPGDLLQDYSAGPDLVEGGREVEEELHGEEKEKVAGEGLRKGLTLPDDLLEDYYALETKGSTDLSTVSNKVDFSTELNQHFESSTEEEEAKSTSGGKSFTGNLSTTLQPSHNEHWKGEGKAKGNGAREKVKSGETGTGKEELLRQGVEDEQVEGEGTLMPSSSSISFEALLLTKCQPRYEFDTWWWLPSHLSPPCRSSHQA